MEWWEEEGREYLGGKVGSGQLGFAFSFKGFFFLSFSSALLGGRAGVFGFLEGLSAPS